MTATKSDKDVYELRKRIMLWAPALYFFVIVLAAIYSYKKPEYNWDMLAYMALVLKTDNQNIDSVHYLTYTAAKKDLPAAAYKNLTDSLNAYRKKMREDPDAFNNQLPFYIVKPLYIILVYTCNKTGISLPAATVLPSILSYIFLGFLLIYWLKKYLSIFFASSLSLFIMLSTPMLGIAKLSTPDALSAFLLFSSFYFILEKQNIVLMFIFMCASVFARIDNIITSIAIIGLLAFLNKPFKKQSIILYGSMLLILSLCYFSITVNAGSYGWGIFYYDTFSHYISPTHEFHTSLILKDYLHLMYANGVNGLYHSQIVIFFAMILSLFIKRPLASLSNMRFEQLFSLLIVLIIIVRFIVYPDIGDRSYIPFYLIVVIFVTRMITGKEEFFTAKK